MKGSLSPTFCQFTIRRGIISVVVNSILN